MGRAPCACACKHARAYLGEQLRHIDHALVVGRHEQDALLKEDAPKEQQNVVQGQFPKQAREVDLAHAKLVRSVSARLRTAGQRALGAAHMENLRPAAAALVTTTVAAGSVNRWCTSRAGPGPRARARPSAAGTHGWGTAVRPTQGTLVRRQTAQTEQMEGSRTHHSTGRRVTASATCE